MAHLVMAEVPKHVHCAWILTLPHCRKNAKLQEDFLMRDFSSHIDSLYKEGYPAWGLSKGSQSYLL